MGKSQKFPSQPQKKPIARIRGIESSHEQQREDRATPISQFTPHCLYRAQSNDAHTVSFLAPIIGIAVYMCLCLSIRFSVRSSRSARPRRFRFFNRLHPARAAEGLSILVHFCDTCERSTRAYTYRYRQSANTSFRQFTVLLFSR
jgi:hypothetical protein